MHLLKQRNDTVPNLELFQGGITVVFIPRLPRTPRAAAYPANIPVGQKCGTWAETPAFAVTSH